MLRSEAIVTFVLVLCSSLFIDAFQLSAGRVGKSCATATGRVTMHFEEALLGNSLLTQESLTRERYIATNRFKVRSNAGAKFEKRWADRKSRLADLAGFRFFTLLKRVDAFDSDYKDDGEAGNYISFTIWENKDNFDAWRTGDGEFGVLCVRGPSLS